MQAVILQTISPRAGMIPEMLPLVAQRGVPIVLMHMKGNPKTMQVTPNYNDVVSEIRTFLAERLETAQNLGIDPANILLDSRHRFRKKRCSII